MFRFAPYGQTGANTTGNSLHYYAATNHMSSSLLSPSESTALQAFFTHVDLHDLALPTPPADDLARATRDLMGGAWCGAPARMLASDLRDAVRDAQAAVLRRQQEDAAAQVPQQLVQQHQQETAFLIRHATHNEPPPPPPPPLMFFTPPEALHPPVQRIAPPAKRPPPQTHHEHPPQKRARGTPPSPSQQQQQQPAQPPPRQALLTASQKRANHIQSEQKRRANIRAGYAALCNVVPGLREDDRSHSPEDRDDEESRSGPRSEGVVLSKTIDHIQALLARQTGLMSRLAAARTRLPPGFPAPERAPWERAWDGGTGRMVGVEIEDGDESGDE